MCDRYSLDNVTVPASGTMLATDFLAMDWFNNPALRELLTALNADGACTRIVGGAVRNSMLGQPVSDIDLATTLLPEEAKAAASAAGYKTIDTGLSHGTITAVRAAGDHFETFEITTLRHDVETFGRHATVAFTDDWSADAARRDFTMNAVYLDQDGTLFDPVAGIRDLEARTVRFVGDPDERIEEDYLRILRFFRFSAQYGDGRLDPAGLAACGRKRAGLAMLSAERVRKELLRLLTAPFACDVLCAMEANGLLGEILGTETQVDVVCRLATIEAHRRFAVDPVRRLGALVPESSLDPGALKQRLQLSNRQADALASIKKAAGVVTSTASKDDIAVALYSHGRPAVWDGALVAWARQGAGEDDDGWGGLCDQISDLPEPVFPLAGRDLVERGVAKGPEIGRILQRLETCWLQHGCNPGKTELLKHL